MIRLRLLPIPVVLLAVLGSVTATGGAVASAAPTHPTTHPAAPTQARAYQLSGGVRIAWQNPHTAFDHVVVRYARGTAAPAAAHGTAVKVASRASSATITKLAAGTRYAVSIWTRDRAGHFSARLTTGFTTVAKAVTGTVAGTVTDVHGHPLKHVLIVVYSASTEAEASTDTNGRWTLSLPPGDGYSAIAFPQDVTGGSSDDTGYAVTEVDSLDVHAHRTTTHDLTLAAAGALSGKVVDSAGHPLKGVEVSTQAANPVVSVDSGLIGSFSVGSPSDVGTTTGADGTYTVKSAPSGAFSVCFAATASTSSDPRGYDSTCLPSTVAVAAGAVRSLATVALAKGTGGAIDISVTGGSGRPVAYASLFVSSLSGTGDDYDVVNADAKGKATVAGLAAGRYDVCADGGPSAGVVSACTPAVVRDGRVTAASVRLPYTSTVTGTVRGPGGKPLPGAEVIVTANDDGGDGNSGGGEDIGTSTDGSGQYRLSVQSGSYVVCASATGSTTAAAPTGGQQSCYGGGAKVSLTARTTRTGIDMQLRAGSAVAGTVTTAGGVPVRNAGIIAVQRVESAGTGDVGFVQSAADGSFRLGGLAASRHELCALLSFTSGTSPTRCAHVAAAKAGTTTHVDLHLPMYGTALVHARGADAVPLAGADAVLFKACSPATNEDAECAPNAVFSKTQPVSVAAAALTDGDGAVPLQGVAPGDYALCVFTVDATSVATPSPSGYTDHCTQGFDITVVAGHTTSATFTSPIGATVSGRVTDSKGKPIAGVRVEVSGAALQSDPNSDFSPDGLPPADAVTAADGTYSLGSATPGAQTVCFDAQAAGTTKSGYKDQCIGSAAGRTDDPAYVVLSRGANTGVDATLQTGPPRIGQDDGSGDGNSGSGSVGGLFRRAAAPAPRSLASIEAWWRANAARLARTERMRTGR